MDKKLQEVIFNDEKIHNYLLENSDWYKYLNRNPNYYQDFIKFIKKKYRLNPSDKISDALDNIDLMSSIIKTLNK